MNEFEIVPFDGIGHIKLGITQEAVRAAIGSPADNIPAHTNTGIEFPESDYFLEKTIQVTYEPKTGLVDWISINDNAPFNLNFKGLNLFKSEVMDVVAHTEKYGELDTDDAEFGYSYCFPKLGICFWRSSKTDDLVNEVEDAEDDEERKWMLEDIETSKHFQQISIFTEQYSDGDS
jgi:hypothetical protein